MTSGPLHQQLPRITVFAETGAFAGDVVACLSGRFQVEHVTSTETAAQSLADGTRALLIMGWATNEQKTGAAALAREALKYQCRVLALGPGGLDLGQEASDTFIYLPELPSPRQLFASLSGLEKKRQARES